MSLIANHGVIDARQTPTVFEVVTVPIANGTPSPAVVTFSRAPRIGEVIIMGMCASTGDAPVAPSGFANAQTLGQATGSRSNYIFYRISTGTEGASINFPYTGTIDFKEIWAMLVSGYNPNNVWAADQSRSDEGTLSSPQNLLVSAAPVKKGDLVIVVEFFSNTRPVTGIDNGFTLVPQLLNQKSFMTYKHIAADGTLNASFTWSGGGTTVILTNWIQLNG